MSYTCIIIQYYTNTIHSTVGPRDEKKYYIEDIFDIPKFYSQLERLIKKNNEIGYISEKDDIKQLNVELDLIKCMQESDNVNKIVSQTIVLKIVQFMVKVQSYTKSQDDNNIESQHDNIDTNTIINNAMESIVNTKNILNNNNNNNNNAQNSPPLATTTIPIPDIIHPLDPILGAVEDILIRVKIADSDIRYYIIPLLSRNPKYIDEMFMQQLNEQYFELINNLNEHMQTTWLECEIKEDSSLYQYIKALNTNELIEKHYPGNYFFQVPLQRHLQFRELIKLYLSKQAYESPLKPYSNQIKISWVPYWAERFYIRFPNTLLQTLPDMQAIKQPFFTSWLCFLIIEIFYSKFYSAGNQPMCDQEQILYLFFDTFISTNETKDTIEQTFDTVGKKIMFVWEKKEMHLDKKFIQEYKKLWDKHIKKWIPDILQCIEEQHVNNEIVAELETEDINETVIESVSQLQTN